MLVSPATAAKPSKMTEIFRSGRSSPVNASSISIRQKALNTFRNSYSANFPDAAYEQDIPDISTTRARAATGALTRSRSRSQNKNAADRVRAVSRMAADFAVAAEHRHTARKNAPMSAAVPKPLRAVWSGAGC